MGKYFMRRIQEEGGNVSAGVEVHDTLDAAVLSFYGRMKTAYNDPQHPDMTFVSCKVKDEFGGTLPKYDLTWNKNSQAENRFFVYHVRKNGETYEKGLDTFPTFDAAKRAYAAYMEYGFNNSKFPNMQMVSCEITDRSGAVMFPYDETWVKTEEPAAE